jgi:hypothetical protein
MQMLGMLSSSRRVADNSASPENHLFPVFNEKLITILRTRVQDARPCKSTLMFCSTTKSLPGDGGKKCSDLVTYGVSSKSSSSSKSSTGSPCSSTTQRVLRCLDESPSREAPKSRTWCFFVSHPSSTKLYRKLVPQCRSSCSSARLRHISAH